MEPVSPQKVHDNVSKFISSPICGGISPRFNVPLIGWPARVIFVVSWIL